MTMTLKRRSDEMEKKITITDPMQVKAGDKAYFKGCDFGFTVHHTDNVDPDLPFTVVTPFGDACCWAWSSHFDHATREVEAPEWTDPHDLKLHVYLGADGVRYIYNPIDEYDAAPWLIERHFTCRSRESAEADHRDALPLVELKLVPKEEES